MRNKYSKKYIIFIILIGTFFLSFSNLTLVEAAETPGFNNVTKYSSEIWTLTWETASDHEESHFIEENPIDNGIIWAQTTGFDSQVIGYISHITPQGEVNWSKKCDNILNINYSAPLGLAVSEIKNEVYVALAYYNESTTWSLALLGYDLYTGRLEFYKFIEENIVYYKDPTIFTEERFVSMDISSSGDLIMSYVIGNGPAGSDCRVILFDTNSRDIDSQYTYTSSNSYNWIISIECLGSDETFLALIGQYDDSGGDYTSLIGSFNYSTGNIEIITQITINFNDQTDYKPIGMSINEDQIFIALTGGGASTIHLVKYTNDFNLEIYSSWAIANTYWRDFLITNDGDLMVIGFGTNSFDLGSNQEQGIILTGRENSNNNEFTFISITKFGDLDNSDRLMKIIETSNEELFLCGYGKSYGDSSTYLDDNAYLVKFKESPQSSAQDQSDNTDCNCIDENTLMWSLIGGFLGIIGIIFLLDRRKNNLKKLK